MASAARSPRSSGRSTSIAPSAAGSAPPSSQRTSTPATRPPAATSARDHPTASHGGLRGNLSRDVPRRLERAARSSVAWKRGAAATPALRSCPCVAREGFGGRASTPTMWFPQFQVGPPCLLGFECMTGDRAALWSRRDTGAIALSSRAITRLHRLFHHRTAWFRTVTRTSRGRLAQFALDAPQAVREVFPSNRPAPVAHVPRRAARAQGAARREQSVRRPGPARSAGWPRSS